MSTYRVLNLILLWTYQRQSSNVCFEYIRFVLLRYLITMLCSCTLYFMRNWTLVSTSYSLFCFRGRNTWQHSQNNYKINHLHLLWYTQSLWVLCKQRHFRKPFNATKRCTGINSIIANYKQLDGCVRKRNRRKVCPLHICYWLEKLFYRTMG